MNRQYVPPTLDSNLTTTKPYLCIEEFLRVALHSSGCSWSRLALSYVMLSCQGREVQVLGGADRWRDSYHAVNILFDLPNAELIIFPFPQRIASILILSHHLNSASRVLLFSGCIFISNPKFNPAFPLALTDVSLWWSTRSICCQGRYTADRRSYKQEFKNTLQEGLFLVEYEHFHFSGIFQVNLSCLGTVMMYFLALVGGFVCIVQSLIRFLCHNLFVFYL